MIAYKLERSLRKTLSITVGREAEVIVRAPHLYPQKMIDAFILQKERWILKNIARVKNNLPTIHRYADGEEFFFLGNGYRLIIKPDANKKIAFQQSFITSEIDSRQIKKLMSRWYKYKARELLELRLLVYSQNMQIKFSKFRLSSAKTRWGSCSTSGTVSLNWKLIMAPIEIIDYVVVHELSHVIHPNHSINFWKHVENEVPDYKLRRKWLKENGSRLTI